MCREFTKINIVYFFYKWNYVFWCIIYVTWHFLYKKKRLIWPLHARAKKKTNNIRVCIIQFPSKGFSLANNNNNKNQNGNFNWDFSTLSIRLRTSCTQKSEKFSSSKEKLLEIIISHTSIDNSLLLNKTKLNKTTSRSVRSAGSKRTLDAGKREKRGRGS